MRLLPKNRASRWATIGGVAALASVMAYASQSLASWHPQHASDPGATASAVQRPGSPAHAGSEQRRSPLLRSGTNAQRSLARALSIEKSPQTEQQIFGRHVQQRQLDASQRMPQQAPMSRWVGSGFDATDVRKNVLKRPSIAVNRGARETAAASCSSTQFASLSGQALVTAVTSAPTSCINDLFGLSGSIAANTFSETKMATIASGLTTVAGRYDGTNRDGALQLILFLRAGYYVQFYDPAVGSYGATLRNAIRPALDAFANNANFGLVNDVHGEVLAEYVTLIDSSAENARYMPVVKRLLDGYNSSYDAYFWMLSAVNNTFTVLFRGHQNTDFQQLVQSDNSIIDTLYGFANRNFNMMGGTNDYLVSNSGRELGRFLQYTGSLKSLASSRVKALVDRSSVTGVTAPLWVGLGEMVDYYDSANCSYYGLCNFKATVESAALPIRYTCSSTLTLRAQQMTSSELANTCSIVGGEESYFHNLMNTGRVPVANDNNTNLEMVIFNSSTDYGTYAGAIFGIDTNNGGMYLEGDPSVVGNQGRFIAYEAEWVRPTFEIWNLTHEYIHYLDGRFDMYGDFNAYLTQPTVWWIEGFAEYMSYSYRNLAYTDAQNEAAKATYSLSAIQANDYNSGQTRIYNWGYLAVRYMMERQPSQVNSIMGYTRPGNYTGYGNFMRSIGTSNDADFRAWLPCVAQPGGSGCGGTTNKPPVASFTSSASGLAVQFTDGSTDPDGSIVSRAWTFGDGGTSVSANPSHAYASAGTYSVQLKVTDNAGATATVQRTVTVTSGGGSLPECPAPSQALGRNCVRSNITVAANDYAYMYVYVPSGISSMRITVKGGTGNADLYVNTLGSWATRDYHNYRSTNAGNNESVVVNYPPAGYVYVSLYGVKKSTGVSVSVEY